MLRIKAKVKESVSEKIESRQLQHSSRKELTVSSARRNELQCPYTLSPAHKIPVQQQGWKGGIQLLHWVP